MDHKELSKVADSITAATIEEKKKKIQDAIDNRRQSRNKENQPAEKVEDSKEYTKFKVTDNFVNLKKKIKDDLYNTETTEDAVEAVLTALEDQPAEQVLAAAIEVLAETIDVLQTEEVEGAGEHTEEPEGEGSEE